MAHRVTLGLTIILLTLSPCLVSCWENEEYNYKRDYANQEVIAKAYIRFLGERGTLASSLATLVSGGYLPDHGCFYQDIPRPGCDDYSFKASSYGVFVPEGNRVESLRMIARKVARDGRDEWYFEPMINAMVRDEVVRVRSQGSTPHPEALDR